jgi:small subunit ribosomal protein S15
VSARVPHHPVAQLDDDEDESLGPLSDGPSNVEDLIGELEGDADDDEEDLKPSSSRSWLSDLFGDEDEESPEDDDIPENMTFWEFLAQPLEGETPKLPFNETARYKNMQEIAEARNKYKIHEKDTGSPQYQIAMLTVKIKYMTEHMQKNKKDKASLRGLIKMVNRRRKCMEYLLRTNRAEFDKITSELNLRTGPLLKPKEYGARGRPDRQKQNMGGRAQKEQV